MDKKTKQRCRVHFARVCEEVNYGDALPDQIAVEVESLGPMMISVEYAWKPVMCSHCKGFDHITNACKPIRDEWRPKVPTQKSHSAGVHDGSTQSTVDSSTKIPTEIAAADPITEPLQFFAKDSQLPTASPVGKQPAGDNSPVMDGNPQGDATSSSVPASSGPTSFQMPDEGQSDGDFRPNDECSDGPTTTPATGPSSSVTSGSKNVKKQKLTQTNPPLQETNSFSVLGDSSVLCKMPQSKRGRKQSQKALESMMQSKTKQGLVTELPIDAS